MEIKETNPYVQYMYSYPHKTAYRPLGNVPLETYAPLLSGPGHGLYLHIPFCQAKCGYCNLFSVAGEKEEAADRYLDAVERQCGQYRELLKHHGSIFSEITVGGGTPLLLSPGQLERMFHIIHTYFQIQDGRELMIETAPNQTSEEKLDILKRAKVTRISMGIQSFQEEELFTLKRQHGAKRAREALRLLKSYDFPRMNLDFIYGIPGQTKESLLESLKEALAYEPQEIFLYPLYVKQGTYLGREGVVLNPGRTLSQYYAACDFLKGEGFRQDSMRRFVRAGDTREFSECGLSASLALGCGGRSYLGALHFCSPYAVRGEECRRRLKEFEETADYTKITHGILLSLEEQKRRYVIRHLLIYPGLDKARYEERFHTSVRKDFPILGSWLEQRYIEEADGCLRLTEDGMAYSDFLGPQLISKEVRGRMMEWEERYDRKDACLPGRFKKL